MKRESPPTVPEPLQPLFRVLREAIARLNEIGEDEVDSHLAWQAKRAMERVERWIRDHANGSSSAR